MGFSLSIEGSLPTFFREYSLTGSGGHRRLEIQEMVCISMANVPVERNSRKVVQRLKREGWSVVSIEGSHHKLAHPSFKHKIVLVHPKKDLPIGTVRQNLQGGRVALSTTWINTRR
jgi:predicted RNA binding protein YcfA (HicA-like mRNA interferase family)